MKTFLVLLLSSTSLLAQLPGGGLVGVPISSTGNNSGTTISNVCAYTVADNTNYILVTTAGTAATVGAYKFSNIYDTGDPDLGEGQVYTNAPGTYGLTIFPNGVDIFGKVTNSAGTLIYDNAGPSYGQWVTSGAGSGANPQPFIVFGNTTNCQDQIVPSSGAKMTMPPLSTNLYVNSAIGSDAFGTRGRMDLPYKTLYGALTNAVAYDTIYVSAGIYTEVNQLVNTIAGLRIIGASRESTYFLGAKEFRLGNSNYVANLTTDWTFITGVDHGAPTPATNCIIENVRAYGTSDCAYWVPYGGEMWNCKFTSQNDVLAFPSTSAFMTNVSAAFTINNCILQGGSSAGACISMQGFARIHVNGGQMKVSSSGRTVGGANGGAPTYSQNIVVLCNGVLMIAPASGQLATTSTGNGSIILTNNCLLRLDSY